MGIIIIIIIAKIKIVRIIIIIAAIIMIIIVDIVTIIIIILAIISGSAGIGGRVMLSDVLLKISLLLSLCFHFVHLVCLPSLQLSHTKIDSFRRASSQVHHYPELSVYSREVNIISPYLCDK